MNAVVKASLYIGTILLVGAGGYRYFITRSEKPSRILLLSVVTGFLLLALGSITNLALTVMSVLGRVDAAFIWQYATNTQHGRMTFLRLGLSLLLVPVIISKWRQPLTVVYSFAALGLLSTFSALSHATTMQGTPAFITDLIHISSASLWVGAITFSVLDKGWKSPNFEHTMKRVSSTALVCVLLLISTGVYTSLIHVKSLEALFSTGYGRVLLLKVGLFSLVLGLAAFNRWYFLPRLLARKNIFQKVLVAEVILLFAVLALTGLLTVSPLPHEM
jgi:putative copper export protein